MHNTHPLAARAQADQLTLDEWLRFPHIRFGDSTPGVSSIDRKLAQLDRVREVAVITQSHRENVELIRGTSLLLSLPARLQFIVEGREFVLFTLPLDVPQYPYYFLHHQRIFGNPAAAFIRNLILELR